jgi:hypothetical protein
MSSYMRAIPIEFLVFAQAAPGGLQIFQYENAPRPALNQALFVVNYKGRWHLLDHDLHSD